MYFNSRITFFLLLLALAISPSRLYAEDFCTLPPLPRKSQLTASRLEKFLSENESIRSIDQLVPALGSFRDDYALVFDSQSAQKNRTTSLTPRALLFGGDAQFIITYTGCPSAQEAKIPYSDAETIETLEYDIKSESFVLKEFRLAGTNHPGEKAFLTSEANPPRCLHCHGNPPRPLWEPYPKWHGVYGSKSDADAGVNTLDVNSGEADNYHAFRDQTLAHPEKAPRYSKLKWKEKDKSGVMLSHGTSNRVNEDLNQILQELNLRSRLTHLLNSPIYQKYRYALFETLSGVNCQQPDWSQRFLPKVSDRAFPTFKQSFERIAAVQLKERIPFLETKYGQPPKSDPQKDEDIIAFLAKIDTILAREGEHLKGWSTSFDERYNLITPGLILPAVRKFYMEWVKRCDPSVSDLFSNVQFDPGPLLGENTYDLGITGSKGVRFNQSKEICSILEKKTETTLSTDGECMGTSAMPIQGGQLDVFDQVNKL